MAISGKDCDRIARGLLDVRPDTRPSAPFTRRGWERAGEAIADALHDRMGLDLNGNRRFQRERFYKAAGLGEL